MKRLLRAVLAITAALILASPATIVGAVVSYEWTGGNAYVNTYTFYKNDRLITTPWEPGYDVVFNKASGPPGLKLGTHNCGSSILTGPFAMVTGEWRYLVTIASSGTVFCVYSFSSSGSGAFTGTIGWDGI